MAQAPKFVGLCLDANLYIVKQEKTVIAYDMNSREERWRYDFLPLDGYLMAEEGLHHLILCGKDGETTRLVVLEKATGAVLWERRERFYDPFRGITVLPNSDWFVLHYARGETREGRDEKRYCLLFSPDGKGPYRGPEDMWPREWREEGKTLVMTTSREDAIHIILWDIESDATQDIGIYRDGFYMGRVHQDNILLSRFYAEPEPHYTLKVVNEDTGRPLRDVTLPGQVEGSALAQGGRAILITGEKASRIWMLDVDTDAVLAEIHQPDHEFILTSAHTDDAGRIWMLSSDRENNGYLWQVETGAIPRKIFDGGIFISGYPFKVDPPHVITLPSRERSQDSICAYNFEERRLVAEWKPSRSVQFFNVIPSQTMRRCAVKLSGGTEAQRKGAYTWEILETGISEPLLRLEDIRMLVMSPDGEYAVTQAVEDNPVLLQVSTGQILFECPLDKEDTWAYAAFAQDSRTVAVYGGFDAYTVVRITKDGCVETPLDFRLGTWLSTQCLSPDGTRLLSATRGEAWLHDTTTGRQLHRFVEPQQLRSQYVRTPNVFGIKMPFVNYLGDLAGNFTNLANSKPLLEAAFIGDGARMVTVAESQMMRVWDCQTGRSVHTIDAGLSNTRNEGGFMENNITLSGNGAYALTSNGFDRRATLWDLKAGTAVKKWSHWKRQYFWARYVSDDGKSIYLNIDNSLYWLEGR